MDFLVFNNHIKEELFNEYGGSEKKRTVVLDDGEKYLLKFPDPIREVSRQVSYINNAISEYIGCHIFESVGIPVQKTILGIFTTEEGKEKVACACQDICKQTPAHFPLERLFEAEKLELRAIEGKKGLSFEAIKTILTGMRFLKQAKTFDSDKAYEEYCDRFIIDAFIGNTDRHNGNWGFLLSDTALTLAPVYDCGSSLSPLLSDEELTYQVILNESQNAQSIICDADGTRIHYRDYLLSGENKDIDAAVLRMIPRINIPRIAESIHRIPYISEKRKAFYQALLTERYEKVLIPTLNRIFCIEKSEEYKEWNSHIISYIFDNYLQPYVDLPDGSSGPVTEQIHYLKNSYHIFFLQDDICVGYGSLEKTNRNVCQFVQSARRMGYVEFDDMDLFRQKVKNVEQCEKQSDEYER